MIRFILKTFVITELEIRKIFHDPTEIVLRTVQPTLWLLIFGQVFQKMHPMNGSMPYIDFMTPGILAQSVLFISIFYGIAVIWERDLGLTQKFLVTPTPRTALVLGKALSAGIRSIPVMTIIYMLAFLLKVKLNLAITEIFTVLLAVVMASVLFSTFSLIIACLVKTRERFMGIGQVLTMPLFFASNAIYPIDIMPRWLQILSHVNPLTYTINVLRSSMLQNQSQANVFRDLGILMILCVLLIIIGGALYKRVII
ncbi:ABC transporter permease [Ferruginibacter paludis]|uniref:ABC transporter permease n=1 Tax=Ferruginibacter paludis TaxID=1310417 RepID=UPI0025B57EB2|nr:ABC transporter permease [Ferruginibacter paludis]MDN3659229.1 ABC transporter permease [Ferruginibacter paludis]